ncbi:MAG: MFS transporter [Lentilactobacillus diolivorans]
MKSRSKSEWMLTMNASIASYLDASLLVTTGIVLALWKTHFGFNAWWVGAISTIVTLSVALGSLIGGYLSDRFGRVKVFNLDILFVALGTLIVAFSVNLSMLIAGLFIAGVASGADLPTSLAVISERTEANRYGKVIASTEIFWLAGIVLSQGLGFLTADLGYRSTQILFFWLFLVAFSTWAVRALSPKFHKMEREMVIQSDSVAVTKEEQDAQKIPFRKLMRLPRYFVPMIGLTGFYLFWNIPANTWGSFLNYFLVTIDGRSQQFSTLSAFFANILGAFVLYGVYMKLADTKYRYVMTRIGLVLCIGSFILSAIYGGMWLVFTISYFVYCMANMLHGEPLYKIWSQSLYPVHVRASVTGITYAVVRAVTAIFSFITPVIMAYSPELLIWLLVGSLVLCWLSAELIMRFIAHHQIPDPVYNPRKLTVKKENQRL